MGSSGEERDTDSSRVSSPDRSRLAFAIGAAILILGGVAFAAYGLTRPAPPAPAPEFSSQASGTQGTVSFDVDHLWNNWDIAPDGQSFAGYRIDETYKGMPDSSTVTGRTAAVKGHLVIHGRDVIIAAVEVDVTQLKSDDPKRDDAMKTRGLETDRFPKAVFVLSTPINLLQVPPPGSELTIHAVGNINLHGVVKPFEVDLKASVVPGEAIIEVIGAQTVNLRDFGIEPPDVAGLLTVKDQGALEFKLRFVPA